MTASTLLLLNLTLFIVVLSAFGALCWLHSMGAFVLFAVMLVAVLLLVKVTDDVITKLLEDK